MFTFLKGLQKGWNLVFPMIMLFVNILSLALGFMYFFGGNGVLFPNPYGLLMLAAFLGNICLAGAEVKYKNYGYLYLTVSFLWMAFILFVNSIVSAMPQTHRTQSNITAALVFSLFLLGGDIAGKSVFVWKTRNKADTEPIMKVGKKAEAEAVTKTAEVNKKTLMDTILRWIHNSIIIILSVFLYLGLYLAINLFRVNKNMLLESTISSYALFLSIIFLSIGVLIMKLVDRKRYSIYYSVVLATTIFVFLAFILPLVSVPTLQKNAKQNYVAAFGDDYRTNIHLTGDYYRQHTFSLPEYFYGSPSGHYKVKENVPFYQGSEGVDKGLELYFDVYTPVGNGYELPGGNSVLIRIHGGGWTSGDKGVSNGSQMNKYFASQGYVVFDIQYGLNDKFYWLHFLPIKKYNVGSFNIDDMVRHIGIFTDYLVKHKEEYHANVNSVFLSGGSAGGQLALASGLGMVSGKYRDLLNPSIQVKGIIPYYPANGLSLIFDIGGREEFLEPAAMVTESSPPCLIYQGTHDGLVDASIPEEFRTAYIEKGNSKCAIIKMPFGGHGSDSYFPGYYNQIFLYYMERFMFQYR